MRRPNTCASADPAKEVARNETAELKTITTNSNLYRCVYVLHLSIANSIENVLRLVPSREDTTVIHSRSIFQLRTILSITEDVILDMYNKG